MTPSTPRTSWARSTARSSASGSRAHIQQAISDGAKLVVGGGRPKQFDKGYFIEPTAFVADENSALAQNEVFGPVQTIIGYEDEADMMHGSRTTVEVRTLGGDRWGPTSRRRSRLREPQIRTGTLSVCGGGYYNWDVPFGGYKQSGIGREHGAIGFEEMLESKTIAVPAA